MEVTHSFKMDENSSRQTLGQRTCLTSWSAGPYTHSLMRHVPLRARAGYPLDFDCEPRPSFPQASDACASLSGLLELCSHAFYVISMLYFQSDMNHVKALNNFEKKQKHVYETRDLRQQLLDIPEEGRTPRYCFLEQDQSPSARAALSISEPSVAQGQVKLGTFPRVA